MVGFVKLLEFLLWNRSHEKYSRFLLLQRLQLSWNVQDICCSKQLFRRKDYIKKVRCFLWGLDRKVFLKDWLQSSIVRIALSNINSTQKNGYSSCDRFLNGKYIYFILFHILFLRGLPKMHHSFICQGLFQNQRWLYITVNSFNDWFRKRSVFGFPFYVPRDTGIQSVPWIGHFRVFLSITFKASLSAKFLLW